jgi:hypothetical protein
MALLKVRKEVSVLPAILEADTVYAVRTGAGFDLYISDNTGAIAHLVNSAGGGGATVKTATINVPAETRKSYRVNVADAAVTATSKILIGFGNTSDAAVNDLDELSEMEVYASAYAGGITVQLRALGGFSGDVPINYTIG